MRLDDEHVFLLVGDTPVARRTCASLIAQRGRDQVVHLIDPGDLELAAALEGSVTHAAVLVRDDVSALRYALALAHLRPALPLTVTVFDRTIAGRLRELLPHAVVTSPAAISAPSLAGPCLDAEVAAVFRDARGGVEVMAGPDGLVERPSRIRSTSATARFWSFVRPDIRHQDPGTRMLVKGLVGLSAVMCLDWAWLVAVESHTPGAAFSEAARVLATVGPGPDHPHGIYGVLTALAMLLTIVLTALFTAGLVDRLLEPRLVRINGSGAVPRRHHVIVVGLGQVGFRLCEELRALGCHVVAVERDRGTAGVQLALQAKIPVVIGDGTSRHLLEKLRIDRCHALAAVGSSDLDNIAVTVAASAVSPTTRIVMRAGEHEAVSETRSLLPLGLTRDVAAIAAAWVVARLTGLHQDAQIVCHFDTIALRMGPARFDPLLIDRRDECGHCVVESLSDRDPVDWR